MLLLVLIVALTGCYFRDKSLQQVLDYQEISGKEVENAPLKSASSVVVCRGKQCAPAKLSMSREYIYNSLLQLFDNNNHNKALVCQASAGSHTCLETFITLPITVGITPAYMYIDSVKITDVLVGRQNSKINLILNYNVTFNGQTPDCTPSQSILFARTVDHVLLEDSGYTCKMTSIGKTTIKTIFSIDYIDLDYGFIGGYYSIGLSGPAYGGGSGYMMIRLPKDAYPLSPKLKAPAQSSAKSNKANEYINVVNETVVEENTSGVEVFPIGKK